MKIVNGMCVGPLLSLHSYSAYHDLRLSDGRYSHEDKATKINNKACLKFCFKYVSEIHDIHAKHEPVGATRYISTDFLGKGS
jgi:hypothetical protein